MHSDYEDYAIHWVPRAGSALAAFGAGWTGWCAERGVSSDLPEFRRMRRGRPEMPGPGALLGLHAVLKEPFRLARGRTVWAMDTELMALAQSLPAVRLPRFEVTVFDGQVVLALSRPSRPIVRLTRHIEDLVKPLQAGPRYARYSGDWDVSGINLPGQRAWVEPEPAPVARFHVPLSDRMELGLAFKMVDDLTPALNAILDESQFLSDIALVGNPGRGRPWRLIERYSLAEEPTRHGVPAPRGMACKGPSLFAPLDTGFAIV